LDWPLVGDATIFHFIAVQFQMGAVRHLLGVRRTLHNAGVTRYRRGVIQIVKRPALESIACECYAVLRHNIYKVFPPRAFRQENWRAG
jgi:hypothetical protein